MEIKVEVSARHVHLTQEDFKKIWGKDELTKLKDISQKGQFACEETVTLKGTKSQLSNVRILGPFRDYSKAEISKTDSINLGIDAKLASSGVDDGIMIEIIGPSGNSISAPAAIPRRHFHATRDTIDRLGLKAGERVSVKISGERGLVFNNVDVVSSTNDAVQIDTDEANAAGATGETIGEIIL